MVQILHACPPTYKKAVAGTVPTVVQTAVGLEQEKATGSVEVVGSDAGYIQTLPFPQQLLLPRQSTTVRSGLGSEVTGGHRALALVQLSVEESDKYNGKATLLK